MKVISVTIYECIIGIVLFEFSVRPHMISYCSVWKFRYAAAAIV